MIGSTVQELEKAVLLMEREANLRQVIAVTLRQLGFEVLEAADVLAAHKILNERIPRLMILAFEHPGQGCGELIDLFRQRNQSEAGKLLLITLQRPDDRWRQRYQPDLVIYKPFDIRYLMREVAGLVEAVSPR
jgi:DNA-binding response OmpR family regulator